METCIITLKTGEKVIVGGYPTAELAARAYDNAAREFHSFMENLQSKIFRVRTNDQR